MSYSHAEIFINLLSSQPRICLKIKIITYSDSALPRLNFSSLQLVGFWLTATVLSDAGMSGKK
jgi:hypothetical protein